MNLNLHCKAVKVHTVCRHYVSVRLNCGIRTFYGTIMSSSYREVCLRCLLVQEGFFFWLDYKNNVKFEHTF